MNFSDKLEKIVKANNSLLCVGLDPNPFDLRGKKNQFEFNREIIDLTAQDVCAYKPNIAFYSAAGIKGLESLIKTIHYIKTKYPEIPVLLDAKRGDVGHTSEMYAKELFDMYGADAATVIPYYGFDSLEPFFKRSGRGVFVICRTSNPGAKDFQDLESGAVKVYQRVAEKIAQWSIKYPNVHLEIGATWPGEIGVLRKMIPEMIFLIAGVGAQGGDIKRTLENGLRADKKGLIINSSRGIIYDKSPAEAAKRLKDEINKYR